jgi:hypothetical protein
MFMPKYDFTPTEDLMLEVLIARYRLGELLWTFDSRLAPTVERLAAGGWVVSMHGITENTVRASLTDKAVAQWISYEYVPPIARDSKKMRKVFKKMYKEAKQLKKRLSSSENNVERCSGD